MTLGLVSHDRDDRTELLVCSCLHRHDILVAPDQQVRPPNHLPERSLRNLCLPHDRRIHQSWTGLELRSILGDWRIPTRLYLHLRFDRWTPYM